MRVLEDFIQYAQSRSGVAFMRKVDIANYAITSPGTVREGIQEPPMNRRFTHVSACVVVALFFSGCARQSASADRAQPDPIAVRIATPEHVRVPAEVLVSGTVETPSAPTSVGFLVSGKVIRVGPREGDFVKAGEVLAVIDPADFQFAVEAAVAQSALARAQNEKASVPARPEVVEQARANLSQAEDEFRRIRTLYENESLAPNEFNKYEPAHP